MLSTKFRKAFWIKNNNYWSTSVCLHLLSMPPPPSNSTFKSLHIPYKPALEEGDFGPAIDASKLKPSEVFELPRAPSTPSYLRGLATKRSSTSYNTGGSSSNKNQECLHAIKSIVTCLDSAGASLGDFTVKSGTACAGSSGDEFTQSAIDAVVSAFLAYCDSPYIVQSHLRENDGCSVGAIKRGTGTSIDKSRWPNGVVTFNPGNGFGTVSADKMRDIAKNALMNNHDYLQNLQRCRKQSNIAAGVVLGVFVGIPALILAYKALSKLMARTAAAVHGSSSPVVVEDVVPRRSPNAASELG
jgi:hypothetical protein